MTPTNYQQLQELQERYQDQGFTVLGVPCNQFGGQEPGDNDIIYNRARGLGGTFPVFGRVDVNGEHTHPLFNFLKHRLGSWIGNDLKWNFHKFLIDSQGHPVERTLPTTGPLTLEPAIQELLKAVDVSTLPEMPPFGLEEPTQVLTREDVAELKREWSANKSSSSSGKKNEGSCSAEF